MVVLLAACRIPSLATSDMAPAVPDGRMESAYQEVLAQHTQSAAIYDNFDTRLFVRATWQSAAFVEARLAREATFKAWPADMRATKTAEALASYDGAVELFMGIHANDPKTDDFARGATSIWRLALVIDGREVEAERVERLGRSHSDIRAYYTYLEPSGWGTGCALRRRRRAQGKR